MAEISDHIITGTAYNITESRNYTYIQFNNLEYIKNPQNTTTYTLQYYSGSPKYRIPLKVTFEQGKDYLVFLVQDDLYYVAYGEYGKIELSTLDPGVLDSLRFVYDSANMVQFENLVISPKGISKWEPLTVMFTITINQETDDTIGFIIEHHPPAYLIIDEANTSLKYFQYAKSVPLEAGEHLAYDFTFSSKYTGVNTVVVNYLGHQVLAEPFTVHEPEIASSLVEPTILWNAVYQVTGFVIIGVLTITGLILILKRIRSPRRARSDLGST